MEASISAGLRPVVIMEVGGTKYMSREQSMILMKLSVDIVHMFSFGRLEMCWRPIPVSTLRRVHVRCS